MPLRALLLSLGALAASAGLPWPQPASFALGGATLAEDGATRLGSVLILNVPSLADAEAFSSNEPFRKAGLFKSVKITRMRRGQWNPGNAPSSAEGN